MLRIVRKIGIAVGSFVAAFFAAGLLSGMILPLLGVRPSGDMPQVAILSVITVVLGGLIYRDIIWRERRLRELRDEMHLPR